jgi:PAS domain S-box-containing protein
LKVLGRTALVVFAVWLACWEPDASLAQNGDSPPAQTASLGQTLRFEHLTTEDGLSEGRVWGITQDSQGFMWFATWDGLNRYDGYEFRVYKQDPASINGPGGSAFWVVYADQAGMIWAGSPTGHGLSRFDPTTEQWTVYLHDDEDAQSLGSNNVYAIFEDSTGVLWVGTEGGGLNRLDGVTEDGQAHFTRYQHDPNNTHSLASDFVASIYEDGSGVLWIGAYGGGLHRFDRETETFVRYQHDPQNPQSLSDNRVYSIYEDQFGVLWVGTYGGGLNRFEPEAGVFVRYQPDPKDPHSLSGNTITGIQEDRSGTLWIGTFDGGLDRYNRETDTFSTYQHEFVDPRTLTSNSVASLFLDRTGTLWIGTAGKGISKLDPVGQGFALYGQKPPGSDGLSNSDVRAVLEDRLGDVWIGTWGGLNRLDPKTGRFTHYLHEPDNPNSLSDNHVYSILEDSRGTLWIGVDAHGLDTFDRDTETFSHFQHDPDDAYSLSDNDVVRLYEDRTGILWVGTWSGGLNALDLQSQDGQARFRRYQHDPAKPGSLGAGTVYAIYEDRAGTLWVGTASGGLCQFHRDIETFTCCEHNPQNARSLSDDTVWAIYEDQEGTLWVGTSGGLNRLDRQPGEFFHYTTADGLPHSTVFGILEEGAPSSGTRGYLWLSTSRGLSRFDPEAGTFHNFDASDGLQGDTFNYGAYYRATTGELFFGGPNGLTVFRPDDIQDNPHIPPVYVTGLQLANEPIAVGGVSLLQTSILDTRELALSYRDRILSIEFTALNFSSPQRNRYRYKLEGFEEAWNEVGSDRRFATYTNLDPGHYTFRVMGSNNDGVWNEEGASLAITVTPPWWATWWFRGLLIALVAGLVVGGHRWRLLSLERRSQELEREVEAATRDLNERVKELNCLYSISQLAGRPDLSLNEILQGTAELIPTAFKYPDTACARIVLDDQEFKTINYALSRWLQTAPIVVQGQPAGRVAVGYLEEKPEQDYGPFLAEEMELLDAIAERLGRITERRRAQEALQKSEARYRALVEQANDAIILGTESGQILDANQRYCDLVGYTREDLLATSLVDFGAPEPGRPRRLPLGEELAQHGNMPFETVELHRDGRRIPVEVSLTLLREEPENLVLAVVRDMTERKQMEQALKQRLVELDVLNQIAQMVATLTDLPQALNAVAQIVAAQFSTATAAIALWANDQVEILAWSDRDQVSSDMVGRTLPMTSAPTVREPLDRGEAISVPDILSVPWPAELDHLFRTRNLRAMLVAPLRARGNTFGSLTLATNEAGRAFSRDEISLAETIASDVAAAIENARLYEQAQEVAVSRERQRLARELHDSVTQTLYSVALSAEALPRIWEKHPDQAQEALSSLHHLARGALGEMRSLLFELQPAMLLAKGPEELLQQLAYTAMIRTQITVETNVHGERRLPDRVRIALYRITQEALNNVTKHAEAGRAMVDLELGPEQVVLQIEDDGRGFDPAMAPRLGFGLRSMADRAKDVGAEFHLESQPGQGTQIRVVWKPQNERVDAA